MHESTIETTATQYLEFHAEHDIRIRGTRVGIEHLLSFYLSGAQPEQIAIEFPTVTLEQVHGVLAWYLGHRDAADEYLQHWRDRAGDARIANASETAPAVVQRLREMAQQRVAG